MPARSEQKRQLREWLLASDQAKKRRFIRELMWVILAIFGIRAPRNQLSWKKFWGPFGFFTVLVWATFLILMIIACVAGGISSRALAPACLVLIFVMLGLQLLKSPFEYFAARFSGQILKATVSEHGVVEESYPPRRIAVVSFITQEGERRSAPLGDPTPRPLIHQLSREYPGDRPEEKDPAPPPIGTKMTIAYRPWARIQATELSALQLLSSIASLLLSATVFAFAIAAGWTILKSLHR